MAKTIVSVRLPKTLMVKLKANAITTDCLDVSEHVRSMIRRRFVKSQNPLAFEVKALQQQLTSELRRKDQIEQKEWLLRQLEQLKNDIRGDRHA